MSEKAWEWALRKEPSDIVARAFIGESWVAKFNGGGRVLFLVENQKLEAVSEIHAAGAFYSSYCPACDGLCEAVSCSDMWSGILVNKFEPAYQAHRSSLLPG